MPKKRVFLSFDYSHDRELKGSLIAQSQDRDSPFEFVDVSLQEARPEKHWLKNARAQIQECDVFIVMLGPDTHSAPGVKAEVEVARELRKYRFQIRPQGSNYGQIKGAGPVVNWKQHRLGQMLSQA